VVITVVILLKSSLFMKISIFNLFMVTTIVGLGIALYVEHTSDQLLQSELAAQRDAVAHQRKLLGDARLGHALLCRMAVSKEQDEILEYVRTIPAELLSCVTKEMPEYSPVKLVWFHTNRQLPNGSILPIDKRKKAALLPTAKAVIMEFRNEHTNKDVNEFLNSLLRMIERGVETQNPIYFEC
tara:strand:- start:29 stop:577 length:549 start_codon:yes stop_codon:yes gene_type:complete